MARTYFADGGYIDASDAVVGGYSTADGASTQNQNDKITDSSSNSNNNNNVSYGGIVTDKNGNRTQSYTQNGYYGQQSGTVGLGSVFDPNSSNYDADYANGRAENVGGQKVFYDANHQLPASAQAIKDRLNSQMLDGKSYTGGVSSGGTYSSSGSSGSSNVGSDYLTNYMNSATSSAKSAQSARDALIKARLDQQTTDANQGNITAENDYTASKDQINSDLYNAQENQRATGIQRGIQYSQQQQALEGNNYVQADKAVINAKIARDTSLANIKNKIASLKTTASYDMQASSDTANAEIAKANGEAINTVQQRQWAVEDQQTKFNQEIQLRAIDQADKIQLQNLDQANKEKLMAMDDTSKTKFFNMEQASKEKFFAMDEASKTKFFDMEQTSKEKFFNMDAKQQERMLGLNADVQKEMFNLNSAQQVYMFGLTSAQQTALASMNNSAQINFMNLESDKKIELMKEQSKLSTAEMQFKIKAESDQQAMLGVREFLKKDPTFNPYTPAMTTADTAKLSNFFDTFGITEAQKAILMKPSIDAQTKQMQQDIINSKITNDPNNAMRLKLYFSK